MQPDPDLVAIVDDLLSTDPRLVAAAALKGRVAVVVTPPKPERVRKSTPKKPPPREGVEPKPLDDADEPKPTGAPWLKVARARVVGPALRAAIGDKWAALVQVDGGLFARLRSEDQRRALVLALRPLVWLEHEDGSDSVKREQPPLQCHADTADDLSHLVAALGVDGAEGAAAVNAAERLAGEDTTPDPYDLLDRIMSDERFCKNFDDDLFADCERAIAARGGA